MSSMPDHSDRGHPVGKGSGMTSKTGALPRKVCRIDSDPKGNGMEIGEPVLLDGIAARFKGGRSYVHGSDVIEFLDAWALETCGGHPSKVEFRRPLEVQGVLVVDSDRFGCTLKDATINGTIQTEADPINFLIVPTSYPIERLSAFDEQVLIENTNVHQEGAASLTFSQGASVTEHATSAMKALCHTLLPQHKKWWFARCKLDGNIPASFDQLELVLKRTMAKTLVTAELRLDDVRRGELVFAGAPE